MIDFVFPDLKERAQGDLREFSRWMGERAILTPHNATADELNNLILRDYMPGQLITLFSSDRTDNPGLWSFSTPSTRACPHTSCG